MLSNWLIDTELFAAPDDLSVFQKELPLEWIEQALEQTDKARSEGENYQRSWLFGYSLV